MSRRPLTAALATLTTAALLPLGVVAVPAEAGPGPIGCGFSRIRWAYWHNCDKTQPQYVEVHRVDAESTWVCTSPNYLTKLSPSETKDQPGDVSGATLVHRPCPAS